MKNIIVVLAIIMLSNANLKSQNVADNKIPANVKKELVAKYPTATNVKWEMENKTTYEAVFKLNSESVSANFTKDGKWLETEKEIKFSQLPKAVQDVLNKQYPKAKYTELAEVESPENGKFLDVDVTYNKKKFVVELKPTGEIIKTNEVSAKKQSK
jgi:hypothetical protein